MRKFVRSLVLVPLLALVCLSVVFAHPGKTDADGGHYNRSTGEYHFHHGYPEHQHPNGKCPYDFDDQTGINSGSPSTGSTSSLPPVRRSPSTGGSSSSYSAPRASTKSSTSLQKQTAELSADAVSAIFTFVIIFGFILTCFLGSPPKSKPKEPPKPSKPPTRTICIPPSVKAPPPAPPERPKPAPPKSVPVCKLDFLSPLTYNYGSQRVTLYSVESSCISHIGYIPSAQRLFVRMLSGRIYTYSNISNDLYQRFIRADSIGEFYNAHIKASRKRK